MSLPNGMQAMLRTPWTGYVVALVAVAIVSGLIGLVAERMHLATTPMLYLIAVLATASAFGSGPAALASVAAFLTFNWFFVEPVHTLTVANPDSWVTLLLFLITAGVTGQLAAGQRRRTQEARQREREAIVLYDIARLMSEPDLDHALGAVAERLRQELLLDSAVIEVTDGVVAARAIAGEPESLQAVNHIAMTSTHVLAEGAPPTRNRHGVPGRWVRVVPPRPAGPGLRIESDRLHIVPVKAYDRQVGVLLLVRPPTALRFSPADDRLLSALATQLGSAVERVRLQREATEAEVLRRTDQLKSALLNAVSHDLRTPLASIIASAGSLRQRDVTWSEQERQEFAEAIDQEAQRLNRIVGNLLDLSRIEGGSLKPEKGWYDLSALVDDVLGRLRPVTAEHHLVVDIPENLPPVPLDYVEIDQVLSNLIENAAKYAPPGTEIRVVARKVGQEVQVEVADRGPGIPPAVLPRLFQPFYRGEGAAARPTQWVPGTGLGLAVAKGLIEAHGGRISVENRKGGGTRFVFRLPLGEEGERR